MNQQILNDNWGFEIPLEEEGIEYIYDVERNRDCQDSFYYAQDLYKSTDKLGNVSKSKPNPENVFKSWELVDCSSESKQNLNKDQIKQRNQEESNSLDAALGSPNNKKKKTNTKNTKKKGNGPERNKLARSLIRASLRKKECKTEFECYKRHTNQENLNANKYSQRLLKNYLKYSKTLSIVDFLQQELFIQEFEKQKRIKKDNFHYYQTYAKMLLDELWESKFYKK